MSNLKVFGQPEEVKNVSLIGWIPNCFASTLTLFFSQDSEEPQNAVRLTPCNLRALDHTMKVPLSDEVLLRVDLKNEESKSSFEYIDLDCEDRTLLKELIKRTPVLLTWSHITNGKGGNTILEIEDFIEIIKCLDNAADSLLITTRTTDSKYETEPGRLALKLVQQLGYDSIDLSDND